MQDLAAAEAGHARQPPGTAGETVSMVAQRAETSAVPAGTLVSGIIPPLADPYFERLETGPGLPSGLLSGQSVVLTDGEPTEVAPAAQGGTGKTQLAAAYARALRSARAVDVLVWVTASTREAVIAGFALFLLFSYALSWGCGCLGIVSKGPESAQGVGLVILFPLAIVSNALVPTQHMPTVLRVIADWNPVSAVTAAARHLWGNPNPSATIQAWPMQHPVAASLLWSVALLVIFAPLATVLYRRRTTG